MLENLRETLHDLHQDLFNYNLVVWTSGNISGRDPKTGYIAIKPSGVKYADLKPESMVVLDLDGNVIEGDLQPSSDTASHLYIYRHMPEVNGVVHTHSPYATAFAALGKPIPVYLTAIGDEFGGQIPCGGFALIGGQEIGKVVVEKIGDSPAILLKNHGVFTVGASPEAALKAAVMVEDVAKTVSIALQMGTPDEIPPEDVKKLHRRYMDVYGQK
jgi:L-ribulose-5-phosphate 4-epimerase